MNCLVMLAALSGAPDAGGGGKNCHPPPAYDGGGYPGYHNHGGWGRPYGGYAWPGYHCPEYGDERPKVTLPPEALISPPPPAKPRDADDDLDLPPAEKKDGKSDKGNGEKKGGKDSADEVGLEVMDLTPGAREYLGYAADVKGVVVSRVKRDGKADKAGLQRDVVIVRVDGLPVTTAKEAIDAIKKGSLSEGIVLRIRDPLGKERPVTLRD